MEADEAAQREEEKRRKEAEEDRQLLAETLNGRARATEQLEQAP